MDVRQEKNRFKLSMNGFSEGRGYGKYLKQRKDWGNRSKSAIRSMKNAEKQSAKHRYEKDHMEEPVYDYLNGRTDRSTSCGHCGLKVTKEGYDGCIGKLEDGVMNACCGHGVDAEAYVQFNHKDYRDSPNGCRISGEEAIEYIRKNSKVYGKAN